MKKARLGRLVKIKNAKKIHYPNVNDSYMAIWVKDEDGSNPRCLLFTESDLAKAQFRAEKNKEDLTCRSTASMLLD